MKSFKNQQSGFTLVEIAIVLVIIGLLLGGVLKGQELINSAKVKALINDFRAVPTYVYAYQDKYRALPGDDRNASTNVGTTANPATSGNGDGRIAGAWNAFPDAGVPCNAGDESCHFWQHVRLSNLATGTTTMTDGNFKPNNAEGANVGITSTPPVPGWAGNFFVCSDGIQGRFARQIDSTIDDGKTNTGTVRVIGPTATPTATTFPVALLPDNDATLYTVCQSF